MSKDELASLILYTYSEGDEKFYSELNKILRSPNRSIETLSIWTPFLYLFLKGLKKLVPSKAKVAYRGVNCIIPEYQTKFEPGRKISWYTISSTSTNLRVAEKFAKSANEGTLITISPVIEAYPLSSLSFFETEYEICFPPGSKFECCSIVKTDDLVKIHIKQIPSMFTFLDE